MTPSLAIAAVESECQNARLFAFWSSEVWETRGRVQCQGAPEVPVSEPGGNPLCYDELCRVPLLVLSIIRNLKPILNLTKHGLLNFSLK